MFTLLVTILATTSIKRKPGAVPSTAQTAPTTLYS